jgi:hypothetical protein
VPEVRLQKYQEKDVCLRIQDWQQLQGYWRKGFKCLHRMHQHQLQLLRRINFKESVFPSEKAGPY